jgi:hypothetical protein
VIHTDGIRTIANHGPVPGDKTASKRRQQALVAEWERAVKPLTAPEKKYLETDIVRAEIGDQLGIDECILLAQSA